MIINYFISKNFYFEKNVIFDLVVTGFTWSSGEILVLETRA